MSKNSLYLSLVSHLAFYNTSTASAHSDDVEILYSLTLSSLTLNQLCISLVGQFDKLYYQVEGKA